MEKKIASCLRFKITSKLFRKVKQNEDLLSFGKTKTFVHELRKQESSLLIELIA